MTDPGKLIAGWLDGSLNEAEQAELNAWLKSDEDNMRPLYRCRDVRTGDSISNHRH